MPLSEGQWRITDIIIKGVGAAVITGCITVTGFWITKLDAEAKRNQERLQALVDFNSAQKNLDVNTGMQLFSKFVDHYLEQASSSDGSDEKTLLMLRLLALNFVDVPINLKPLFEDLDNRLKKSSSATVGSAATNSLHDGLRDDLREVAKEVALRQARRITLQGGILSDPQAVRVGKPVSFISASIPLSIRVKAISADYVSVVVKETIIDNSAAQEIDNSKGEENPSIGKALDQFLANLGAMSRQVFAVLRGEPPQTEPSSPEQDSGGSLAADAPDPSSADREFDIRVSYFDMPIIDNIKLDDDTRIAVILSKVVKDKTEAEIRVASFLSDLAADRFDIKEMTRSFITVKHTQ